VVFALGEELTVLFEVSTGASVGLLLRAVFATLVLVRSDRPENRVTTGQATRPRNAYPLSAVECPGLSQRLDAVRVTAGASIA